jgi:dTDP-4-dehydrorhamnose reductase
MKKILITGSSGLIGSYLYKNLGIEGHQVVGIDKYNGSDSVDFTFDITNKKILQSTLDHINPKIIIHTAAMKDLKTCEQNPQKAFLTNYDSTLDLINYVKMKADRKIIYISSDVVFDGRSRNYKVDSTPNPINTYGETKYQSEVALSEIDNSTICRTAMVLKENINLDSPSIAVQKEINNKVLLNQSLFIEYVYYSLKRNKHIYMSKVFISNPTPLSLLLLQIERIIKKNITGILHTCGPIKISRYDFAKQIAKNYSLNSDLIISSEEGVLSYRPRDISLDVNSTYRLLDLNEKDWDILSIIKNSIKKDK